MDEEWDFEWHQKVKKELKGDNCAFCFAETPQTNLINKIPILRIDDYDGENEFGYCYCSPKDSS